MYQSKALWLAVAMVAGISTVGLAQQATSKQATKSAKQESTKKVVMKEQKPGLLAKAKVSADSAQKLASSKESSETLSREEIREENGKLMYTFWFKGTKSGVDAVDVDATTGSVAAPRHESKTAAKAERKGTTTQGSSTQKKS